MVEKSQLRNLGAMAEKEACAFLKRKGYRIVERNIRSKLGEIDLIANYKTTLIFVEVKSGRKDPDFPPWLHFTIEKQHKLLHLAQAYCAQHRWKGDCRFDLITVTFKNDHFDIEHMQNVVEDIHP